MTSGSESVAYKAFAISVLLGALGLGLSRFKSQDSAPNMTHAAPSAPSMRVKPRPSKPTHAWEPMRRPLDLTDEEREKGHWECAMPDPGDGPYLPMEQLLFGGWVVVPKQRSETNAYDVVLHFHGFSPVRKAVVKASSGVVFAGWDFGTGTDAYRNAVLSDPQFLTDITHAVVAALKRHHGADARIGRRILSAWSAGYAAIGALLKRDARAADAVILLDGLHAPLVAGATGRRVDMRGLDVFVDFAERAMRGDGFFYISHSKVATDYASTSECVHALLDALGLALEAAEPTDDPLGLRSFLDVRGLHVRSFGGSDKRAHCDHTRHIAEALELLSR